MQEGMQKSLGRTKQENEKTKQKKKTKTTEFLFENLKKFQKRCTKINMLNVFVMVSRYFLLDSAKKFSAQKKHNVMKFLLVQ